MNNPLIKHGLLLFNDVNYPWLESSSSESLAPLQRGEREITEKSEGEGGGKTFNYEWNDWLGMREY